MPEGVPDSEERFLASREKSSDHQVLGENQKDAGSLGQPLSPERSSMLLKEVPSITLPRDQAISICGKARRTPTSPHVPHSSLVFLNLVSHFVGTITEALNCCPQSDFSFRAPSLSFLDTACACGGDGPVTAGQGWRLSRELWHFLKTVISFQRGMFAGKNGGWKLYQSGSSPSKDPRAWRAVQGKERTYCVLRGWYDGYSRG